MRGQGLRFIIPHADFSTPLFSVWHSPLLLVGSQVLNFSGFSPGNKPLLRECEIRSYLTVMGKNSKPGVLNIPHPDFPAISLSSSSPFFLCHARPCNSCNDFCVLTHTFSRHLGSPCSSAMSHLSLLQPTSVSRVIKIASSHQNGMDAFLTYFPYLG